MDVEDIKYLWPAYKNGETPLEEGLSPSDFQGIMEKHIGDNYELSFLVEAPTKKGKFPIGILFANHMGPFLNPTPPVWFSWASPRNKIEGMVKFLNDMRKDYLLAGYCMEKDKRFLEYIARHGIIRRVGKITGIYKNEDAPFFQSRN